MKRIFFVLAIFFAFLSHSQDALTVLYVKGKVVHAKTQAPITRGTKLTTADELKYSSKNDMIAAISPSKGRILIKPGARGASPGAGGELAYVIRDIYTPMGGNAMTRGAGGGADGEGFANAAVMKAYFQQNSFLVLAENRIVMDAEVFPQDEQSFFFIQYQWSRDDEPVNKKLPFDGNEVIIRRDELLTVDGAPIAHGEASGFLLFYMDEGEVEGITAMNFYFPDQQELEEELRLIKAVGVDNPWSEAQAYVEEAYGKYDPDALKALFDSL
jgi:hypothetical protein